MNDVVALGKFASRDIAEKKDVQRKQNITNTSNKLEKAQNTYQNTSSSSDERPTKRQKNRSLPSLEQVLPPSPDPNKKKHVKNINPPRPMALETKTDVTENNKLGTSPILKSQRDGCYTTFQANTYVKKRVLVVFRVFFPKKKTNRFFFANFIWFAYKFRCF